MDHEICSCCRTRRVNLGQPPRPMIPVDVGADEPLYLCAFCDGDAVTTAKAAEESRSGE